MWCHVRETQDGVEDWWVHCYTWDWRYTRVCMTCHYWVTWIILYRMPPPIMLRYLGTRDHPLGLFSLLSPHILSWTIMESLEHWIVIVFLLVNKSRTWRLGTWRKHLLELPYLCQPSPSRSKHLLAFFIRMSQESISGKTCWSSYDTSLMKLWGD